jgi:hypothetical protein
VAGAPRGDVTGDVACLPAAAAALVNTGILRFDRLKPV